jgi:uncharacterized protein (TIGR02147 family)
MWYEEQMENVTYKTILEEELSFRIKENSSYSLRAFARDIGISPSQLSDVLKSKTGLSSKKALSIANNLSFSSKECEMFKALVEVEHGRSSKIIEEAKKIIEAIKYDSDFKGLSFDGFKLISDWEYFAILSTMELDDYDGSVQFISQTLGLELSSVEECIKRLLKLDLIDLQGGKFIATGEMFGTSNDIESSALKRFHKQHLKKSLNAIDNVPVELRDITTMTMAIDINKIQDAKKLITKFRRELSQFLEADSKTDVYNINIQLIPLKEKVEQ